MAHGALPGRQAMLETIAIILIILWLLGVPLSLIIVLFVLGVGR